MSTGLSKYPEDIVVSRTNDIKAGFYRLMDDASFIDAITYGTNDMRKVRHRFVLAHSMFTEVLNDQQN
jgi:hypothetical protein